MKVEIHRNLQQPIILDATRVLLTFDDGTPFAFALDYIAGVHCRCWRVEDPDFQQQLYLHGIDRVVFVDKLKLQGDDPGSLNPRGIRGIIRG